MIQSLKTIAIYCIIFLSGYCLYAQQNITRVEYYIDSDPGYGNATPINLIARPDLIDSTIKIDPATLTTGVHILSVRAKDALGAWSLDNKWLFVKYAAPASTPDIVKIEYYIDTDPGYGNATDTVIIPGVDLSNLTHSFNPSSVSPGVHIFGVRAKDSNGAWSLDNKWLFVKNTAPANTPDIVKIEYYVDTDPGYGNATDTVITPGTDLSGLTHSIDPSTISNGVHIFGIRAKDENGAWSLDNKWLFVKNTLPADTPAIVRVEYYVDVDPGYGKASPANITLSKNLVNIMQDVQVGTLHDGVHFIGIRALDANGAWSLDNKLSFTIVGPLPIILSNFNGRYINNANELTVVVEQAVNVKAIQVEKGTDGTNFTYLGDMAVAPVTPGTLKFEDENPAGGNNFYRLRIVDNDGKVSYSNVILLNHTSRFIVQMYPNPVQDNLTAHFENAGVGIYTVRVTDITGKNMLSHKVSITQNNQTGDVNISFSRYTAGAYFIQVTDGSNNIVATQKIIKR